MDVQTALPLIGRNPLADGTNSEHAPIHLVVPLVEKTLCGERVEQFLGQPPEVLRICPNCHSLFFDLGKMMVRLMYPQKKAHEQQSTTRRRGQYVS
jgi:hypothetical protein